MALEVNISDELGNGDIDFIILSLALTSIARPGTAVYCGDLAKKLNPHGGMDMFEHFRQCNAPVEEEQKPA